MNGRHEKDIQELVDGGLPAIEKYEEWLGKMKIRSLIDADARGIGYWICKQARERLANQK